MCFNVFIYVFRYGIRDIKYTYVRARVVFVVFLFIVFRFCFGVVVMNDMYVMYILFLFLFVSIVGY